MASESRFYAQEQKTVERMKMRYMLWLRLVLITVPIAILIYTCAPQENFTSVTVKPVLTERQVKPKKWVSLCDPKLWGNHRTGNHLFMLSAMLHLAQLTNRTLIMPRKGWKLDRVFDLQVERFEGSVKELCPCRSLVTPKYDYDRRFDDAHFVKELAETNDTLLLCGLSQTFRHAQIVERELRRQLKFPNRVIQKAEKTLRLSKTSGRHVNIAVHVRRGDFLKKSYARTGLTVADRSYFKRSFKYFTSRHARLRFFVETDDYPWSVSNLPRGSSTAEIVFSRASQEVDLAIVSMCHGIVLSTGTFGWWGAWLAKKTTVYFNGWPRNGSALDREFNKKHYFMPHWIPL